MLQAAGMDVKYGDDFGSPEETYLSDQFDQPVFVLNYPKAIKPFYMLTDPEDEQQYVCADMLAPEGYGEIIGGSERKPIMTCLDERRIWFRNGSAPDLVWALNAPLPGFASWIIYAKPSHSHE